MRSFLKKFSFDPPERGDASESEKPLSVDLFGDTFPPSFPLLVCALVMGGVAGHVTPMGSPIVMGRVIPILLETPTLTLDSPIHHHCHLMATNWNKHPCSI